MEHLWEKGYDGTTAADRSGSRGDAGSRPSSSGRRFALAPLLFLLCLVCTESGMAAVQVLPLGDSITHGRDAYPSYRAWLYGDLRELGYDVDFVGSLRTPALPSGLDPDNEGHSGYTAGQVVTGLPGWLEGYPIPDVALVHLGTNDAIRDVPRVQTIADLREVIGRLRARNPSMSILVAQIIPTSVASINERIVALNREIAGLQALSTSRSPVIIVDQYSGYNGQADNQMGGVHPLTSGEKKMTARWKGMLLPVLDRIAPPETIEFGPHVLPGRIEVEDYDTGGYLDTTPGNAGGAYRHDDVDIEYAASEGSYAVGWVREGEWVAYTANVTTGGMFILNARVASPNDGRTCVLTINGTGDTVIQVPNTGSFNTYATVTLGVVLPAGLQRLTLRFSGDGQNLNWLEFAPGSPAPTETVPPLPPRDVTDLRNTTYAPTSITWTWTDPVEAGFANVTVCLDGVPVGVVARGVQKFTATNLDPATVHTIGTRTRNTAGVTSPTWVNHTASTAPASTATGTPVYLPVPPAEAPPADLDGDGVYDDINGNGRKDFADVVLYFNQMSWIAVYEPVEGFDCNGNGCIDFADVVALFNSL